MRVDVIGQQRLYTWSAESSKRFSLYYGCWGGSDANAGMVHPCLVAHTLRGKGESAYCWARGSSVVWTTQARRVGVLAPKVWQK